MRSEAAGRVTGPGRISADPDVAEDSLAMLSPGFSAMEDTTGDSAGHLEASSFVRVMLLAGSSENSSAPAELVDLDATVTSGQESYPYGQQRLTKIVFVGGGTGNKYCQDTRFGIKCNADSFVSKMTHFTVVRNLGSGSEEWVALRGPRRNRWCSAEVSGIYCDSRRLHNCGMFKFMKDKMSYSAGQLRQWYVLKSRCRNRLCLDNAGRSPVRCITKWVSKYTKLAGMHLEETTTTTVPPPSTTTSKVGDVFLPEEHRRRRRTTR